MKIADMTWMQVEQYLLEDDRCVLPLGSTEQHAYLSLAVDAILSERVAADAAEPLGVPVFPAVAYGLTPYFMAYPGTVTLTPDTYARLLKEVLGSIAHHGFRRILVVNGHGGNREGRPAALEWASEQVGVTLRWHDWWAGQQTMDAVRSIDPAASHASWMEGFPWTRVAGVEVPVGHKATVDLEDRDDLSPTDLRARLGDGCFGGFYERPDEDLAKVWGVAVEETRRQIVEDW